MMWYDMTSYEVRLSAKWYAVGKTGSIQRQTATTVILPEHLALETQTDALWKCNFETQVVTLNI